LAVAWTVDAAAAPFVISGLSAVPTRHPLGPLTINAPGVELYRWKPNVSFYRAEAAPATTITFPLTPAGVQTLNLIARRGGVWQDEDEPTTWTWLFDPNYGSDMSSLAHVRGQTFEDVEGTTVSFVWNGRNSSGVLQLPGWYTIRVRLTDALGNTTFVNQLVHIDELVSTVSPLTDLAAGAEKPDARGAWVVWQQRDSGTPNIAAQNIGGGGGAAIPLTDSTFNQENPRTDGRYAVWQGRRANGNWDVFFADLTDPDNVVAITASDDRNEINPVIDWPWVVWQTKSLADPSAPWQLQATNLETAQLITVNATTTDQLDPAVRAGRVVWQDFRDVGFGEIYFRDLESGEQRRLTNNTFGQYAPDVDGHMVVWQDNRHTQGGL
jgi:beta propeller repeat protein